MKAEIKVPAVGESVTEGTLAEWLKSDGDYVNVDDILLVLETDKASVEIVAENAGVLHIQVAEGEDVEVGSVMGFIDTDAKPASAAAAETTSAPSIVETAASSEDRNGPAVRKIAHENNLNTNTISGSGKDGRVTKQDALGAVGQTATTATVSPAAAAPSTSKQSSPPPLPTVQRANTETVRKPMSRLRQTIARRLLESQQSAAILTTFNEIDMSEVMGLRKKYKEIFKDKYGTNLGFMGFFVKATTLALKEFPLVNSQIDGTDVLTPGGVNMGIAVGTPKGLMVPVIKDADQLSLADVELSIKHYAQKARDNKISIDDLQNGTFTISNGGVYGSMMSTPILNPPQSGILGLHKIEQRPVALDGQVVIRPMMYVALSYDHRIIDGSESVQFLVKIKERMEDPARLLIQI